MKTIKRYMALAIVFVLLVTGSILLMLDCSTIKASCLTIAGAFVCIGAGLVLGHFFDNKNLLPE